MNVSRSDARNSIRSKPRVKRLKVAEACADCRSRKTKCDGDRPVCGPCRIRFGPASETQCGYRRTSDQAPQSVDTGTSFIDLKAQVTKSRLTTRSGQSHERGIAPHTEQPSSQLSAPQPVLSFGQNIDYFDKQPSQSEELHDEHLSVSDSNPNRTLDSTSVQLPRTQLERVGHDAAGTNRSEQHTSAILGGVHPESAQDGFYGGSSVGSFMEQVRKAIEAKIKSPEGIKSPLSSLQGEAEFTIYFSKNTASSTLSLGHSLPPRRAADVLVAIYWEKVHPLYPFLQEQQVKVAYEDLWAGRQGFADESAYLCILNAIFALACQFDDREAPAERARAAEKFYLRAKSSLDIWDANSLGSIQALLLLSQYLQSTNNPQQCWTMVGLAIRTAQSLGLHLPETSERLSSLPLKELFRKVWHGCILMDRVTAMTYGRPVMVHKSIAGSVPLPLSYIELNLSQPSGSQISILHCFVESLKLFRILYEILIRFYSSDPRRTLNLRAMSEYFLGRHNTPYEYRTILALDRDLTDWRRDLPLHLKELPPPEARDLLSRQSVIVHQRFLNVRILNLRPVLSAFVALDPLSSEDTSILGDTLTYRIGLQCSIICVQNAIEAIHLIDRYLHSASEWWYNIMYLYTAATVILAARLQPLILADVSEDAIDSTWQIAISTLEMYEPYGKVVRRLLATIKLLAQQVPESYMEYRRRNVPAGNTDNNSDVGVSNLDSTKSTANSQRIPDDDYPGINIPADDETFLGDKDAFADLNSTDFTFDPNDISWLIDIPFE